MIIGMLGFGLLGSAVSTFVREQMERNPGDPLVTDLAGVLIRGLSAAIIVFLAAEGGLAIVGSGQTNPNPYVLFLGCLVGAVFSQEVWDWARRWMLSPSVRPRDGGDGQPPHQPQPPDHPGPTGGPPHPDGPGPEGSPDPDDSLRPDQSAEQPHASDTSPTPQDTPLHDALIPVGPEPTKEAGDKARLRIISAPRIRERMSQSEIRERRLRAFDLIDNRYSPAEVASQVGIHVSTVYRWLKLRRDKESEQELEPRAG